MGTSTLRSKWMLTAFAVGVVILSRQQRVGGFSSPTAPTPTPDAVTVILRDAVIVVAKTTQATATATFATNSPGAAQNEIREIRKSAGETGLLMLVW